MVRIVADSMLVNNDFEFIRRKRETSHQVLSAAARIVVCPGPKPFVMGLPCVFVIGLLASTIRPRLPVSGADVREIREPHSGETANAFDA